MNFYRHAFTATCPNNGQVISYHLTIQSLQVIMVEEIVEACAGAETCFRPYHENIADLLHAKLGGRQRMVAFHHGVEIETLRGA